MSNLHQDRQNNLVSFLRHNKSAPPAANPNLEQQLIDSLEPQVTRKRHFRATWTIPKAIALRTPAKVIATGFLFTSVSFSLKTPRIALEPKDLENFLVKNWQNTMGNNSYTATQETESYWLLPTIAEPQPALSVSAQ